MNLEEVKSSGDLVVKFNEAPKVDEGFKLLGELLIYLRKEKLMSALMVCKQIKTIMVNGNVATIEPEDAYEKNFLDDKFLEDIKPFFERREMGFKIKEKAKMKDDLTVLSEVLGGRLEIKH